tara:strand:- start:45 stop:227 length:183 start_codon:yes stop_codon:yes gene_type:complete
MKTILEKQIEYNSDKKRILTELKELTKLIEKDELNQKTLDNISSSLENIIHDSNYNYIWE